jgi:hypothetical protein
MTSSAESENSGLTITVAFSKSLPDAGSVDRLFKAAGLERNVDYSLLFSEGTSVEIGFDPPEREEIISILKQHVLSTKQSQAAANRSSGRS